MNNNWMDTYAVVIDGDYMDKIRYVFPLSEKQRDKERKRIAQECGSTFKKVLLVGVHG